MIKSSAAYEQGQSSYSGRSRGVGAASSGRVGIFSGSHSGERISRVAEKNAPPSIDAGKIACLTIGLIPLLIFGGMMLNGLIGLIVGGVLAMVLAPIILIVSSLAGSSPEQKAANENYSRQWYCKKCGGFFQWPHAGSQES